MVLAVPPARDTAEARACGRQAGAGSLECLRLVYRLLFMLYIEARPELSYVPIAKSEVYLKGYSLESLRDLERAPLNTDRARNGLYFDQTLRRLFTLVAHGCGLAAQRHIGGGKDVFTLAPLDSRLFDDEAMPLLSKVRFSNVVWQRVIRLMSESRVKGKRKGRVSYQLLSINQLGAVYEALLAYRGFFALEELYEVQPAAKKTARGDGEEDEDDDADADESGSSTDLLDTAWFVPESRIGEYKPAELVHDVDENGHQKLRKYPKGTFIYRLAGRDREKSASYYTPQVLTRCLVKYALKELLRDKTADDVLQLTVCEPAMGSAAFLNEAVNQLAEAYLERKQAELNLRIPHDDYPRELQRVRMVLADRNVFGVDLNPVAVELAEVSLWLNAIYGSPDKDENGNPLPMRPARVPWFGYQLFAGNSLVGARREVFRSGSLKKSAKPAWYQEAPRRLNVQRPDRSADEIYHFLLPDPGMANYSDAVAKDLYPAHFERLARWRKDFCRPLEDHELSRLQQLSARIDDLWAEHGQWLARDRARTEDDLTVWPAAESEAPNIPRRDKEAIRRQGLFNEDSDLATPFRRLKLVMDYWCALWFWPIRKDGDLPTREEWWMEIGAVLEGNVVDVAPQPQIDFAPEPEPQILVPESQPALEGFASQLRLSAPGVSPTLHDRFGQLRISRLRQHFPRVAQIESLAASRHFLHWELYFADVLARRGGFDLILGNPHALDHGSPLAVLTVAILVAAGRIVSSKRPRDAWAAVGVDYDDVVGGLIAVGILPMGWSVPHGATVTLPPRVLNSCEWPRPETPDAWVFVTENPSVTAAASDLAIDVPTVRLLCTSGTPAASEVAAIARLTLSGWRIAVRADFDSAGLDHVATILTAVPGASPWRMGVADYVESLQKATQEEIRLQRISDAAWDPELSSVMREKGLAAYEEALLPLLLEDIAAGRPVATIRTGTGALS